MSASAYETVLSEVDGRGVRTITLKRIAGAFDTVA